MKTILICEAQALQECHPYFISAILSSIVSKKVNRNEVETSLWQIPSIEFTTENETRVSMTLNGMRMVTEFFAHDSPRVLQLIEQRLEAGQRDVVHDVLVYLWERVLLMRATAQEAKDLQGESLAAYLGLDPKCVIALLEDEPLVASQVTHRIKNGEAGQVQRDLNVAALTENLLARLQPELEISKKNENRVLFLIEETAARLYADNAEVTVTTPR